MDENKQTLLQHRQRKGIWQNMYQFPLLEFDKPQDYKAIKETLAQKIESKDILEVLEYNEQQVIHKLSHQHLYTKFWIVRVSNLDKGISINQLNDYPFPVLITNFLQSFSY